MLHIGPRIAAGVVAVLQNLKTNQNFECSKIFLEVLEINFCSFDMF